MSGTHDHELVVLAILVAVASSYTALDVAARVRVAATRTSYGAWLAAAAFSLGGGIWAMHFVAMLAFSMPGMTVQYDLGLTTLSLLLAVGVVGIGLALVSRRDSGIAFLALSGLLVGVGIAGMHYTGMAAMRMPASINYDPWWFGLSLLIAVGAATSALWLAFANTAPVQKIVAAIVMGVAISGMHFAGMRAVIYSADHVHSEAGASAGFDRTALAVAVVGITFGILFLALVMAMVDRRLALFAAQEAETLRRSEEQLRWLYRRTPLPLHALDQAGRITKVSDAWVELLQYGREEVVGRPISDFMTEASARQHATADWPRLLEAGELRDVEYQFTTAQGAILDVLLTSCLGSADLELHAIGGLVDVTGRRRVEEALRQAQKMEAIGQLTGGVAHDFNNLLAVVMGNLDLLHKRIPNDPRAQALIENATEGVRRGAALTQRMLAFARRQSLEPTAVEVPRLLGGMEDLLRRSIGPQISIQIRSASTPLVARVDANQLELALLNLAVNARDALPDGGAIEISARQINVAGDEVPGLGPGAYVGITVTDNGTGMDEATLARAREPFFTTNGVGKGTGLGLAMVHGFAEQSGGALVLQSRLEQGTSATLWLPATEAMERTGPQGPTIRDRSFQTDQFDRGGVTILAVDDDPLVLMNTVEMLEDLGFRVLSAPSGARALEVLQKEGPADLVITDEAMPGMRGTELAAVVSERWPRTLIILATGYAIVPDGLPVGVCKLDKPYGLSSLEAAVASVLAMGCRSGPSGSGEVQAKELT